MENLRRLCGREPDGEAGRTVITSTFNFGAKSTLRLQNDCHIMKRYETLRHDVLTDMLACGPTIKNFKLEPDALVERKSLTIVALAYQVI